jgi:hypothetical protein
MSDTIAFEYEGETVTLDYRHRFHVPSLEKAYDTAEQAKSAIGRMLAAKRSAVKQNKALALAVRDESGVLRTITGIHAGHGKRLIVPKIDSFSFHLYPDTPTVVALIGQRLRLRAALRALDDRLDELELIDDPRGQDVQLEKRYDDVAKDYALKMQRAEALKE